MVHFQLGKLQVAVKGKLLSATHAVHSGMAPKFLACEGNLLAFHMSVDLVSQVFLQKEKENRLQPF